MSVSQYRELLNYCLRLTKDRELAADTLQESYARLFAASSRAIDYPRAFMRQVVLNVARDHWREERSRQRLFVDLHPTGPALEEGEGEEAVAEAPAPACWQPEHRLEARQRLALLRQAIDSLPERQRQAFLLYRFDNLPHEDIAARMGISVRMVERHVQLAMLHCKRQLQDGQAPSPAHERP